MGFRRGGSQERWAPGEVVSRRGGSPKVVVLRDSHFFSLVPDPLRRQLGRARGAHIYLYPPPWREDVWLPLPDGWISRSPRPWRMAGSDRAHNWHHRFSRSRSRSEPGTGQDHNPASTNFKVKVKKISFKVMRTALCSTGAIDILSPLRTARRRSFAPPPKSCVLERIYVQSTRRSW